MVTIITQDLDLLKDIFQLMLSKEKEKNKYIHVEGMTIQFVNGDQLKYNISMYLENKDNVKLK